MKPKYYSIDNILKCDCNYNVIYGKKSNGKTYALLSYILERYIKHGETGVYVRRYRQEFQNGRAAALFAGHVNNGLIFELSKGRFNTVVYRASKWTLAFYNEYENSYDMDTQPFCYAQALTEQMNGASITVPTCTTLVYDEFIKGRELPNEFFYFNVLISNVKRDRDNFKVFMLGNSIESYSSYFDEMGLTGIRKQKEDTIDIYAYGDSGNKCAVERTSSKTGTDINDRFFAFDNPKLKMITSGEWAIDFYPICHDRYNTNDICFKFFIDFDGLHHCDCVCKDNKTFIHIYPKTDGTTCRSDDLVFSLKHSTDPNIKHSIRSYPQLWRYFTNDLIVYSSNIVGDRIRHFLDKMN